MVRIHLLHLAGGGPERDGWPIAADIDEVRRRLSGLELDGGENGDSYNRLVAIFQETALGRLAEVEGRDGGKVLGNPVTERGLRELLEGSLRKLARQARRPEDHELLINRANAVRPMTLR